MELVNLLFLEQIGWNSMDWNWWYQSLQNSRPWRPRKNILCLPKTAGNNMSLPDASKYCVLKHGLWTICQNQGAWALWGHAFWSSQEVPAKQHSWHVHVCVQWPISACGLLEGMWTLCGDPPYGSVSTSSLCMHRQHCMLSVLTQNESRGKMGSPCSICFWNHAGLSELREISDG